MREEGEESQYNTCTIILRLLLHEHVAIRSKNNGS